MGSNRCRCRDEEKERVGPDTSDVSPTLASRISKRGSKVFPYESTAGQESAPSLVTRCGLYSTQTRASDVSYHPGHGDGDGSSMGRRFGGHAKIKQI